MTNPTAIIQDTQAYEHALPLLDETCPSRFFIQPEPTDRVCLFFHGFTATPYQFEPIGKAFFKAGYNVLIPLMPGHGIAGNWNGDNPPPLPESQEIYQQFGLKWLQNAQEFGNKIIIGGLSGGSTLATWLGLQRPQEIYRILAFAPYLSNSNKVVDLFVQVVDIYFKWRTKPGVAHFGYEGFEMPALRVFLDMGEEILKRAENNISAPIFLVASESDRAVGNREHEELFEAVLKFQPRSWYHRFDKSLDIPHTMMTRAEGNEYRDLLIAIAKAYVESDLTWSEVKEINSRIRQGAPFDIIVNELRLSDRVSAELPAILAAIDRVEETE